MAQVEKRLGHGDAGKEIKAFNKGELEKMETHHYVDPESFGASKQFYVDLLAACQKAHVDVPFEKDRVTLVGVARLYVDVLDRYHRRAARLVRPVRAVAAHCSIA